MQSVTVNGRAWTDFDAAGEWVRLPAPADGPLRNRRPLLSAQGNRSNRQDQLVRQAAGRCTAVGGRRMRAAHVAQRSIQEAHVNGQASGRRAVLLLVSSLPLMGQVGTQGSILGAVVDSSRAALPGATVTVTNLDTGLVQTATV